MTCKDGGHKHGTKFADQSSGTKTRSAGRLLTVTTTSSNCRHYAQPFGLAAKLQDSICQCSKSWRKAVSLVNAKIVLSRCDDAFLALCASREFPVLSALPLFLSICPPEAFLRTGAAQPKEDFALAESNQDVRSFKALHPCALGSLVCWLLRKGLLPEFPVLHISDLSSQSADLGPGHRCSAKEDRCGENLVNAKIQFRISRNKCVDMFLDNQISSPSSDNLINQY
ncbi:hypothetical protein C8J56DRAFT_1039001 [Mycena floridula]|nr:hypothetical protein C8J56DRAFT_1039001 [Mycena floridula]